jgi:hypothetical protein
MSRKLVSRSWAAASGRSGSGGRERCSSNGCRMLLTCSTFNANPHILPVIPPFYFRLLGNIGAPPSAQLKKLPNFLSL